MRYLTIFTLLLAASFVFGQQKSTIDSESIEKLERADATAAKINDIDTLMSLWSDDGVLIMPMSQPIVGKAAIRAALERQKQQSANVETISYLEDWQERKICDNQAFEWGTIAVTMKLPNGKEVSQTAYLGRLLVRGTDGAWRFARVIGTPAPKRE